MENSRVSLGKSAPKLFQTLLKLERETSEYAISAGISEGFAHLLRLLSVPTASGCIPDTLLPDRGSRANGAL
jgi:hypothetical protein